MEFEIKPGESHTFKWGLKTDRNISSTVEIFVDGEGSEFLSYPSLMTLEPGVLSYVEFTVTIPEDYEGAVTINPNLRALERGDEGGQTIVNTEMLKTTIITISEPEMPEPEEGGGCLIATAAYGTELAPQVQFLREIRDNTILSTDSGVAFMTGFNQLYYSFSPIIADMERENPVFQEGVRAFITPMISTLSIMTLAEDGNDSQVLGLGISVIALNVGMYVAAPAAVGFTINRKIKSRK